jgi:hypothetical protein
MGKVDPTPSRCGYEDTTVGYIEVAGRVNPGGLYTLTGRKNLVSIAIVSLLVLVIIVIIAIPILIRVFGEAARRNPNRPEDEGDETSEEDPSRHSGSERE